MSKPIIYHATWKPVGETHFNAKYSDELVAEARRLRGQGWSWVRIAAHLGAHRDTVRRWCNHEMRTDGVHNPLRMRALPEYVVIVEDGEVDHG